MRQREAVLRALVKVFARQVINHRYGADRHGDADHIAAVWLLELVVLDIDVRHANLCAALACAGECEFAAVGIDAELHILIGAMVAVGQQCAQNIHLSRAIHIGDHLLSAGMGQGERRADERRGH